MEGNRRFSCVTFNCRSVKNSLFEVNKLCNMYDVVFLQEHWLLPNELDYLNNVHPDFLSVGKSAVDIGRDIIVGRPYGGTAILYRKNIANSVKVVDTSDPRLASIEFLTNVGTVLFVCVYMPTDNGDNDCFEKFTELCASIIATYSESSAVHLLVAGDFNCQTGTRFFGTLNHMINDNNLVLSDVSRLTDVFTYISDSGKNYSWIDHFVCSQFVDNHVCAIDVLYDFVTSDHRPLALQIDGIFAVTEAPSSLGSSCGHSSKVDWANANAASLNYYQCSLDYALSTVKMPIELLVDTEDSGQNAQPIIDEYYAAIMNCVTNCTVASIPVKNIGSSPVDVVPGWNDVVGDKHDIARAAFVDWIIAGKPRHGPEFLLMRKTRASFKLALRYCKQHEEFLRADALANSLADKDYNKFWNCIRKVNNGSATKYTHTVDGVTGETEIADKWSNYFEKLYNSVADDSSRITFLNRLQALSSESLYNSVLVKDVLNEIQKQKKGKAVGADGIAMEAFMYGGLRLAVHICFLFRVFIKFGYLPRAFMQSVIVPLVKCKSGDLSDMNNYRAIAISTSMSKIFESIIASFIKTSDEFDYHQFGFKAGHSTTLCTHVFKRTVEYFTDRGSHVFSCFIDFTKAFDKVNYWKLFNKLLDDHIDCSIVRVLAYWYSHQEICVKWHNTLSRWFTMSNGTRQGGVLSPMLFSRYIRDLLSALVNTHVGCNIGGVFFNVLAYADDLVLLAPSFAALQLLLNVLCLHVDQIDMTCNVNKTVCMVFPPKNRNKLVCSEFPRFHIGLFNLEYVREFKYLGHVIISDMTDNDDIMREIRYLFIRSNILIRKFSKCSLTVKVRLFKSYCICFYDTALWRRYNAGTLNKFKSAYNKCMKLFFGYSRCYSVTRMLMELGLSSFDTILINGAFTFNSLWMSSNNRLLHHMYTLQL